VGLLLTFSLFFFIQTCDPRSPIYSVYCNHYYGSISFVDLKFS